MDVAAAKTTKGFFSPKLWFFPVSDSACKLVVVLGLGTNKIYQFFGWKGGSICKASSKNVFYETEFGLLVGMEVYQPEVLKNELAIFNVTLSVDVVLGE
jgi:hypothetical protein